MSFFRGCIEVGVPADQVSALRKSHLPMLLPEECFGARFTVCLVCIIFHGFRLSAAVRATQRADLRTKGQQKMMALLQNKGGGCSAGATMVNK